MSYQRALAGTRIPRWTNASGRPSAGAGQYALPVPPELAARLRSCPTALETLLFVAHAKVLGELSAEPAVLTRYLPPAAGGGSARPRGLQLAGSWQDLFDRAESAEQAGASGAAGAEPAEPAETLLDLSGLDDMAGAGAAGPQDDGEDGVALRVAYARHGDELRLILRFRREVLESDFAARIAGYHLAALRLMTADPQAAHDARGLLSAEEIDMQLHRFAGARVPLPGAFFPELFRITVESHPYDVAIRYGEGQWTYRELNERANQVAHLLLRDGLQPEDVVAVATGRTLDWAAAVLGVFKAGGVYLPVRPDFPAARVATQMRRSVCRFGLTEQGATVLQDAVASHGVECRISLVTDAYAAEDARHEPDVDIRPDQVAYIYFTSGSTGEPKGAMCEHLGMINHLLMKIDDLGLGPGEAVAQTASQCFDISLWQLVAPMLVGGHSVIIDTETQLDPESFFGLLQAGGIDVIQIVPSYLEVMLSRPEHGSETLGDLRIVSVTGEALKLEPVRRWLTRYPRIPLVNAYGATEVSDDTMHGILDRLPERPFVSVGTPRRNVDAYILDARQRLAPLGAPGEIAFAGMCVGRGYINDPDRTAQAFMADPYRRGARLYRTGDFGRWLPESEIEFLGRRDEQIKIRGFRVEIGEIENTLLQMAGVRDAAVVVTGSSDTMSLAAFYAGPRPLASADLRDFLAGSLPDYMVPSYFQYLEQLPLTENGKADKRALKGSLAQVQHRLTPYAPPATETEERLATAWAETLNTMVGMISRNDDFFRLGGTSLAAVRLVMRFDRAISLRQLVEHPVLADLAAVIDAARPASASSPQRLLQRLSAPLAEPVAHLVCFPYAGGNALNFRQLAAELERSGISVYAVEPPGHDVARSDEPLAGVLEVARRVEDELDALPPAPLLLWGQCAGSAPAVELARRLEAAGRPAARLFIGALMLDEPGPLQDEADEVGAMDADEITARLRRESTYIELDDFKVERVRVVGDAYRHDVCTSNAYFIEAQEKPEPLGTPVEVVVAADDPTTAGYAERHRRWGLLARAVELREFASGGHYFTRTEPAAVAALVTGADAVGAGAVAAAETAPAR